MTSNKMTNHCPHQRPFPRGAPTLPLLSLPQCQPPDNSYWAISLPRGDLLRSWPRGALAQGNLLLLLLILVKLVTGPGSHAASPPMCPPSAYRETDSHPAAKSNSRLQSPVLVQFRAQNCSPGCPGKSLIKGCQPTEMGFGILLAP